MNTDTAANSETARVATTPPITMAAARPRRSRTKRRSFKKLLPWVFGILLLVAIIAGMSPKPLPVEVAKVTTGPLTVTVLEEGKTRIRQRYTISPPVSGYLLRPELRAGAPIEAGETVLAAVQAEPAGLLNPRVQAEAEARVNAAEAAVNQREAELDRARSAAELAQKELARVEKLEKSGAVAARELDQAQAESAVRGREMRAAEFALNVSKFELRQAEAALMQAKGTPEAAQNPIAITSPVNGYVLNVFEESARIITAGTPIMEVGDPTDLEAEIELLSTDAAGVQTGAEVSIERWGGPKPLRGHVTLVEPAAFTKVSALGVEEQRVKVRVNFDELPPDALMLGDRYRVEARIVTWHSDDTLQIPTGALFRRGGDWMCFVVDGGKARLQKVEIGQNNGIQAQVLSGIKEGQQVILHPPDAVSAGSAVAPRADGM